MSRKKSTSKLISVPVVVGGYGRLVSEISGLLEQARRGVAKSVNAILTATYWEIGRRIVEHEQGGKARAEYGEELLGRLSRDLTAKFGRGFSRPGLQKMRVFYLGWEIWQTPSAKLEARVKCPELFGTSTEEICSTPSSKLETRAKCQELLDISAKKICSTPSSKLEILAKHPKLLGKSTKKIWPTLSAKSEIAQTPSAQSFPAVFPLSWSHYVRLMSVEKSHARLFYECEAIRGGWSVRQLDRQISTRFFERTAKSKQRATVRARGRQSRPEDVVSVEDEIRDPYLLEFLNLKDEYSESELEEALVRHLEAFLMELGAGFAFVARQKRIRVGNEWYRIDLLLYHRRLRCLVVIDLKVGKFAHADAGQMNLYLNYLREHAMEPGENEPVGIILCSEKDDAVVHYAMGGIKANVFSTQYLTELPAPETLRQEMVEAQYALESRAAAKGKRRGKR